jgi:hypothetical protein
MVWRREIKFGVLSYEVAGLMFVGLTSSVLGVR